MKKLFLILAASAVLFACGGSGNGNNKAENKAEKTMSVEEKAVSYAEQLMKAMEDGNMGKAEKIMADMEAWGETLSPSDQMKAEVALENFMNGGGASDDYGYDEYDEEDYGDYGDYGDYEEEDYGDYEEEDYGDYEDEDYGDYDDEDYGDYEDYDEEW